MPDLAQAAGNAVASGQSSICTVSMERATTRGSLVVVIAVATHPDPGFYPLFGPSGFTLARSRVADEITMAVWYRENCPPLTSVSVITSGKRSLQVRVLEYSGVAQANALDRVALTSTAIIEGVQGTNSPRSGLTGTTGQADEVVVAAIANRYASTIQSGFTGGLSRLSDSTTPSTWGSNRKDSDEQRSRLTVHQAITTQTGSYQIGARLSTSRDWIAIVLTFRGGTTGPLRMSSRNAPPLLVTGGGGRLNVFGPLRSGPSQPPLLVTGGGGRIGPFEGQFRLGGWTGLLIGEGTDYRVEQVQGVGGYDVRTSDGEFPRGDGAQRGIDLQAARQMLFTVNFDERPALLEARMAALIAALVPQRDTDWDLLFRLPGRPLQIIRSRPTQLTRQLDAVQMLLATQSFALQAADPRIYSARQRVVEVPVSAAGSVVTAVSAVNTGNARAYPTIRIDNRGSVPLAGVALVNASVDVAFEVNAVIPPGGQLIGDMPARVTAAPRSPVTIDGASRYGSWSPPREPFYLAPDPITGDGVNALYLRTSPEGADVQAVIEYRDTWAG